MRENITKLSSNIFKGLVFTFSFMPVHCISCRKEISTVGNSVIFDCPKCGKEKIIRCGNCRSLAINYECPKCGFKGL